MTEHLSEEQLQTYLDGRSVAGKKAVQAHLKGCGECRNKVQAYQQLFEMLQTPEKVNIPANFAEEVLQKMESLNTGQEKWVDMAIFGGILTAIGGGVVYQFGWRSDFGGVVSRTVSESQNWLQGLSGLFEGNWLLFISAASVVLLMILMDKILVSGHYK